MAEESPELVEIGPYELLEPLGAGGMGKVYKARHRLMNRIVALKLIQPGRRAGKAPIARFLREIQTLAKVAHPNIVAAHDAAEFGDSYYLVMEYVDGVDLGRLVNQQGPLSVSNACEYIRQTALGLNHLHERNLVHRDVKPGNIILDRRHNLAKLLDFGLARLHEELEPVTANGPVSGQNVDTNITQTNELLGTPDFMAPEQASSSSTADIRADIYSLGCTLYFLLAGRPPFAKGDLQERIEMHKQAPAAPLHMLRPEVPSELSDVVEKMTAKKPEERYQTPAEVADALAPFCGRADAGITFPTPPQQSTPVEFDSIQGLFSTTTDEQTASATKPTKKRRWQFIGSAAILLAILAVAIVWQIQRFSDLALANHVLAVGQGKQFASIGEAMKQAKAKDEIHVYPGVYNEKVVIEERLKIIGRGKRAEIIIKSNSGTCIEMKADAATVQGLTLHSEKGSKKEKYPAVRVSQGRLTVVACEISSDSHSSVIVHEPGTHAKFTKCKLHNSPKAGLFVYAGARCILEECSLINNTVGIAVEDGGNPLVVNCRVCNNRKFGVLVYKKGLGKIEGKSLISGNGAAGLMVQDEDSDFEVKGSTIEKNAAAGVLIDSAGRCTVYDCDVRNNKMEGIQVRNHGSRLMVTHSRIRANAGGPGIWARTGAFARIENCLFRENGKGPLDNDRAGQIIGGKNDPKLFP